MYWNEERTKKKISNNFQIKKEEAAAAAVEKFEFWPKYKIQPNKPTINKNYLDFQMRKDWHLSKNHF